VKEYPKINSIFKRDEVIHKFLIGQWSQPEFEYLANNEWVFTEKVDGTNIRVVWSAEDKTVRFGGKTNNAQIPTFLFSFLQDTFLAERFVTLPSLCVYGEGYGAKIQKGGGNYKSDGVSFVLFDVLIDIWWLQRKDVEDIANKLGVEIVPIIGHGKISDAISLIQNELKSKWGDFQAEGLVLRPKIELFARNGNRIITKLKYKDF